MKLSIQAKMVMYHDTCSTDTERLAYGLLLPPLALEEASILY